MSRPAIAEKKFEQPVSSHTKSRHQDAPAVIEQVRALLAEGRAQEALDFLCHVRTEGKEIRNAYGVCLMRLGRAGEAVQVFRKLVLPGSSLLMSPDAPIMHKSNFATSLLLSNEVSGAMAILAEIGNEQHPSVSRLKAAISRWKKTLGILRRVELAVSGGVPKRPVQLDFPPGDL